MNKAGLTRNPSYFLKFFLSVILFSFVSAANAFAEGGISVFPDKSLFIQIINFIFLIWVLNIIVYRPIRGVLVRRKEKVDSLEQDINKNNNDALEKDNAFHAGVSEARVKGMKEKTARLEAATEEEKRIIGEINKKAQANLVEVRTKISKDVENVKGELQKEIDAFADAISGKILGRAV